MCIRDRDKGGNGIDVSGMGGGNEATYPFKIPVIMNPKTSNMRIGYDYPQATCLLYTSRCV